MTDPKIVVQATGDFRRLNSDLSRTESRMGKLGRAARTGLGVGFALAGAAVVGFGVKSVQSLARIERLNTQTAQAIKSTGGAAGVTAKHVEGLTGRLENLTATEAESIQGGANFLLTFTNIKNGVGKTNKIFDQAVVAMTDMSRALDDTGGATLDTRKTALQLGKALNDPIKGVTALSRVGVSFTEGQKKTIASLVESGDTMKAQKVILHELTKEFGGSGEAFAKTAQGKMQLAGHALGTFGETITKAILPALSDLAVKGTGYLNELTEHGDDIKEKFSEVWDAMGPGVDEIVEAFRHLVGSGDDLGGMFDDKLIPAIRTTSEFVGGLVNFIDELPGPVKDVGFQVGLAAIAFNILSPKVTAATTALSRYTTGAGAAAARTAKLKAGLSAAAGIGGMVALSEASSVANDTVSDLMTVGGGALLGFSVGGPIGAAIGGGIGLIKSLSDATENAGEKAEIAGPKYSDFADSLDQVTGSATDATTALARQALSTARVVGNTESAIQLGREMGLSQRTIVQASLGNKDALDAVTTAINKQGRGWHDLLDADGNVIGRTKGLTQSARFLKAELGLTTRQIGKARRETLLAARDTQEWSGKLKAFPKKAATRIELNGVLPTVRGIAQVVAKYKDVDKKNIRTLLEVTGVDASVKDIKRAADEIKATDRKTARTEVRVEGALKVRGEYELTRQRLAELDGNRADTYVYNHTVNLPPEGGGGRGAGNGAGTGRLLPTTPELEDAGTDAGVSLGKALIVGMRRTKPGKTILSQILAAVIGGSSGVNDAIAKLNKLVEQRTKDDKAGNARQKQILRGLADEYAALKRNGKAQDEINRKLEKAKEHLSEVRAFVDGIRDSFIATGDVTQLGQLEDGTVSGTLLIDQLRDQVAHAQRFADLIRELTAEGLNQTSLQQLLQAGPEAGLATAEALAQGGSAAVDEINNLTQQLEASGQTLGGQMSDQFFDVGLQASLGLVQGLEAQDAALDRAAQRLARKLAAAVRHALGIKSPSKEFESIGLDTVRGLTLGLDDTYVRRQGQKVAASLVEGFANPKLAAGVAGGSRDELLVTVKLSAHEVSQLQRGKSVTLDISRGGARGVRRPATGGAR